MRRGTNKGAELRTEDVRTFKTKAHRAIAHERVGFVGEVAEALIAAEIEPGFSGLK